MNEAEPVMFNLIDQPWLTVRTRSGTPDEVSLLEAFGRAHELVELTGEVPTQVFALTRLLLAVLHRVVEGPRDLEHWRELWEADQLPVEKIADYLERHRSRFDLLHPQAPFLQVAGLRTAKGEVSDLAKLIADVPNGHPFFTTRFGPIKPLSYAEAARWVVHCHAFDPSGIKSGAVGDARVKGGKGYPIGVGWSGLLGGVLPQGNTLRETMLLNLITHDHLAELKDDLPAWEREPVTAAEQARPPQGPLDLYTWQSRRIRLVPEDGSVTGVLICNGDKLTPQNLHGLEPHSGWRRSQAQEKKLGKALVYMPREHDPSRQVWRGLTSILKGAPKSDSTGLPSIAVRWLARLADQVIGLDYPVWLRTVGMTYGAQSSTTEDIVDDRLKLHSILVAQAGEEDSGELLAAALDCVKAADEAARALGWFALRMAQLNGLRPRRNPGISEATADAPRDRAVEQVYAELDGPFRSWLASLTASTDVQDAKVEWHRTVKDVVATLGKDLMAQVSMPAWAGRTIEGRWMTAPLAERWFRGDLRRALPFAHLADDTEDNCSDSVDDAEPDGELEGDQE